MKAPPAFGATDFRSVRYFPAGAGGASSHRVLDRIWIFFLIAMTAIATTVPATALAQTADDSADPVERGKRVFNNHCFHCHGADAVSPLRERDLRRLKRRYGERASQVFFATVTAGRPERGMPSWAGKIDGRDLTIIKTFLDSVQE